MTSRRALAASMAVVCALTGAPRALRAQVAPRIAPEIRLDVIASRRTSVQAGAGVEIPAGPYVRVGLIAGAGTSGTSSGSGAEGRFDVLARFLLDPFRQARWGLSAGGGLSMRAASGDQVRPRLLVALDLEGPRSVRGMSPAFQLGLGGGARIGVALRGSGPIVR